MLGPALTEMLRRLATIEGTRTEEQKRVLNELAHLYRAVPLSEPEAHPSGAQRDIYQALTSPKMKSQMYAGTTVNVPHYGEIHIAGVTTGGAGRTCPCCGFKPVP
jgi:hypothetical protein